MSELDSAHPTSPRIVAVGSSTADVAGNFQNRPEWSLLLDQIWIR